MNFTIGERRQRRIAGPGNNRRAAHAPCEGAVGKKLQAVDFVIRRKRVIVALPELPDRVQARSVQG